MSQCHERFADKLRINLLIEKVSLNEAVEIVEFYVKLKGRRKRE